MVVLNNFSVFPVIIVNMVKVEVVLISRWNIRGFQLLTFEILPRKVLEPRMIFDLFISIKAKPILRLSLNALINKVLSFLGPAFRNLVPFDLDLSCHYLVSYVSS